MVHLRWFGFAFVLAATVASAEQKSGDETKTATLRLAPTKITTPFLQHRLEVRFEEQIPGNAAIQYWRAIDSLNSTANNSDPFWKKADQWRSMPLDKLRGEKVEPLYRLTPLAQEAVLRTRCDWDLPIRQSDGVSLLLPEIAPMMNLGRLAALEARLALANGKPEKAIRPLRDGLTLSRHIGELDLLISDVVGTTVAWWMCDQLEAYVQTKDAANLYWPLTALPTPLLDYRKSLHTEAGMVYLMFPKLRDIKRDSWRREDWDQAQEALIAQTAGIAVSDMTEKALRKHDVKTRLLIAARFATARKSLIESGISEKEIEAWPPSRVVVEYTLRLFIEARDEFCAVSLLPTPQAIERLSRWQKESAQRLGERELVPLATLLLPNMQSVVVAHVELNQRLAVLRGAELVRHYAATHEGKLPARWEDEATLLPPLDPATGQTLKMRVDGTSIVVEPHGLPGKPRTVYRLEMAR